MDQLFNLAKIHCESETKALQLQTYSQFVAAINESMDKDFNAIVNLLYRIDVDEEKIRALPVFDAQHIADLIIERLKKTLMSRNQFKNC